MTTKLAAQNLDAISTSTATPSYDRSTLSAGIVHFGVGNFHRAHQAVYLDSLFNTGSDHGWAIVGAGVLPSDEKMRGDFEAANLAEIRVGIPVEPVREQLLDLLAAKLAGREADAVQHDHLRRTAVRPRVGVGALALSRRID